MRWMETPGAYSQDLIGRRVGQIVRGRGSPGPQASAFSAPGTCQRPTSITIRVCDTGIDWYALAAPQPLFEINVQATVSINGGPGYCPLSLESVFKRLPSNDLGTDYTSYSRTWGPAMRGNQCLSLPTQHHFIGCGRTTMPARLAKKRLEIQ